MFFLSFGGDEKANIAFGVSRGTVAFLGSLLAFLKGVFISYDANHGMLKILKIQ